MKLTCPDCGTTHEYSGFEPWRPGMGYHVARVTCTQCGAEFPPPMKLGIVSRGPVYRDGIDPVLGWFSDVADYDKDGVLRAVTVTWPPQDCAVPMTGASDAVTP